MARFSPYTTRAPSCSVGECSHAIPSWPGYSLHSLVRSGQRGDDSAGLLRGDLPVIFKHLAGCALPSTIVDSLRRGDGPPKRRVTFSPSDLAGERFPLSARDSQAFAAGGSAVVGGEMIAATSWGSWLGIFDSRSFQPDVAGALAISA